MSDDNFPMPGGFDDLPEELRELLASLTGGDPEEAMAQVQAMLPQFQAMMAQQAGGPVNWEVARRVAFQVAADEDRDPTPEERERVARSLELAEHWLDSSTLPAPPDGGRLLVGRRTEWLDGALTAMRPLVEPVAAATGRAMAALTPDDDQLEHLPPGLREMVAGMDMGVMVRSLAATTTGLHAGMALGNLSRQLLAGHDLGIPTAARGLAVAIAVNVAETFDEWELDPEEVMVALMLHEAAHRRLFHAVPWLTAHVESLVATFANGTDVDPARLEELLGDAMIGVDPEDPESMAAAMQRASRFRLEPTEAQQRVLQRLQGVTDLTRAWARHEALAAARDRLPSLAAIDEILRRRRADTGDGEQVLADLLGLQLTSDHPEVADAFVAAVVEARGPRALHGALAHPENLPDAQELAEPSRWLVRMAAADAVPDDASSLFEGLGEAPVEESAEQRLRDHGSDVDLDEPGHGGAQGDARREDTTGTDDTTDDTTDDGHDGDGDGSGDDEPGDAQP